MKVSSYKEHGVEVIKANLNGRKLVVYGDIDREFENRLQEEEIQIEFRVLRNKKLCDGIKVIEAEILEGMSSEYYVLCFSSTNSDKDTEWIRNFGYQNAKDYMFMAAPTVVVPSGAVNWYDKNGNTCNYCPEGCRITFVGRGSEVRIATNIKIKKQLNIRVGDECKVVIGDNAIITEGTWFLNADLATLEIMDNTSVNKSDIIMYSNSKVAVGSGTSIFGVKMRAYQNTKILIGEDCMISQEVVMHAGDGHAIFDVETEQRINCAELDNNKDKYTISIGDHVWCGMSSVMLAGTNIGTGSVLGMGAIAKGKFPNNCSIAGNPAKIVRKNVAWSRNNMDMDIIACGEDYCKFTDETYGETE